jgi:hypothetical protein
VLYVLPLLPALHGTHTCSGHVIMTKRAKSTSDIGFGIRWWCSGGAGTTKTHTKSNTHSQEPPRQGKTQRHAHVENYRIIVLHVFLVYTFNLASYDLPFVAISIAPPQPATPPPPRPPPLPFHSMRLSCCCCYCCY